MTLAEIDEVEARIIHVSREWPAIVAKAYAEAFMDLLNRELKKLGLA
jgi:hypothetical protein